MEKDETANANLVKLPHESLAPETLRSVVEAFVLRNGTDYGAKEAVLETQIQQILTQLEQKKIHLVFDSESETTTFLTDRDYQKLKKGTE